jgi:outer membrane protein assembly factor BamB
MHRLFMGLVVLGALALSALAADWPQYRGADRSNVSPDKGLLKEWPKDGPKLVWKATGVGAGYASVSVFGAHVYTMGNKDGNACIFAIDRKKGGEPLWQAKIGKPGTGGRGNNSYPGPRCTPATDGEFVVGLGPKGDLACVESAKGKEVWKKDLMSEYGGKHGAWEYSESPLIDGDRVVCVPGGSKATMVVLDKKKGTEIWKASLGDGAGYSSVIISNAGGKKQYVVLTASATIGVDAETGKELWRYKKFSGNIANIPTAIAVGDQIFTVAGYSKGAALLTLSKKGDGVEMKEEYFTGDVKTKHGGVVIVGDYAYGDGGDQGNLVCMEWKTGTLKWKKGRAGKGSGSASITAADGHLYVHYTNGHVSLVKASPDGYKETGSFKLPSSDRNSWAHPVVIDGRLYVRSGPTVFCYDVKGK